MEVGYGITSFFNKDDAGGNGLVVFLVRNHALKDYGDVRNTGSKLGAEILFGGRSFRGVASFSLGGKAAERGFNLSKEWGQLGSGEGKLHCSERGGFCR